jgi:hypothetical protein
VQFFESWAEVTSDGGWDRSGMSNSRLAILPGTVRSTGKEQVPYS